MTNVLWLCSRIITWGSSDTSETCFLIVILPKICWERWGQAKPRKSTEMRKARKESLTWRKEPLGEECGGVQWLQLTGHKPQDLFCSIEPLLCGFDRAKTLWNLSVCTFNFVVSVTLYSNMSLIYSKAKTRQMHSPCVWKHSFHRGVSPQLIFSLAFLLHNNIHTPSLLTYFINYSHFVQQWST